MSVEVSLTIIAFSFLVLTFFAAFFFWQARRTAKAVEDILLTLNEKLPMFLSRIEEVLSSLLNASRSIRDQVEILAIAAGRIQNLTDYIFNFEKNISRQLEAPLRKAIGSSSALIKGISAFLSTLLKKQSY